MRRLLPWLIRLYQRLTSFMPPVCRFTPSCSQYTLEAIEVHGVCRGLFLGAWRVLRCNPLVAGGQDPVPPRRGVQAPPANPDDESDC